MKALDTTEDLIELPEIKDFLDPTDDFLTTLKL